MTIAYDETKHDWIPPLHRKTSPTIEVRGTKVYASVGTVYSFWIRTPSAQKVARELEDVATLEEAVALMCEHLEDRKARTA